MTAPDSPISVRFTPEFKRNLHALAKKYRHIRTDVQPVIDDLQSGALPGDQVPGVGIPVNQRADDCAVRCSPSAEGDLVTRWLERGPAGIAVERRPSRKGGHGEFIGGILRARTRHPVRRHMAKDQPLVFEGGVVES